MHPGLGAGREQGFEQLSLQICASALDDVTVSHGLTTKPTPTRRERNGNSGAVCRIRTRSAVDGAALLNSSARPGLKKEVISLKESKRKGKMDSVA